MRRAEGERQGMLLGRDESGMCARCWPVEASETHLGQHAAGKWKPVGRTKGELTAGKWKPVGRRKGKHAALKLESSRRERPSLQGLWGREHALHAYLGPQGHPQHSHRHVPLSPALPPTHVQVVAATPDL